MKHVGFGQAVIGKLKETKIKQNLYYEIKDTLVEEQVSNGQIVRKNKLTKVYGLNSSHTVRNGLIELLRERMTYHKDKFISPTIYQELRGLEVKRNGKVEHSDLTHDDQIFSYLMALYVWYNGKNLRETYGIEKNVLQTEDSVDDIIELEGSGEVANMTPVIEKVNRLENSEYSKLEQSIAELKKNQGIMFSDFMKAQRKHDEDMLKVFLMNPVNRQAYANTYKIEVDSIALDDGTNYTDPRNSNGLPDSLFNDFYKDDDELSTNSIYNSMNSTGQDASSIYDDQIH